MFESFHAEWQNRVNFLSLIYGIAFLWDSAGNFLSASERTTSDGTVMKTKASQIRKSPRQTKTFRVRTQNPPTQMTINLDEELDITTTCNLIILDRYAALILLMQLGITVTYLRHNILHAAEWQIPYFLNFKNILFEINSLLRCSVSSGCWNVHFRWIFCDFYIGFVSKTRFSKNRAY